MAIRIKDVQGLKYRIVYDDGGFIGIIEGKKIPACDSPTHHARWVNRVVFVDADGNPMCDSRGDALCRALAEYRVCETFPGTVVSPEMISVLSQMDWSSLGMV